MHYDPTDVITSVTYDCHSGYRFDDLTTTATVLCVGEQCTCLPGLCESKSVHQKLHKRKAQKQLRPPGYALHEGVNYDCDKGSSAHPERKKVKA